MIFLLYLKECLCKDPQFSSVSQCKTEPDVVVVLVLLVLQDRVERSIRRLQVESHLSGLIFVDLISSFHLVESLEPLAYFFFAFKVIREDGELLEVVVQVLDVDVQVVFGQNVHPKFVLRRDEEGHRVCNHLLGVAPVVFDSDGTILLYPDQGGGAVHPVLAHEVLDSGKVLLAAHLLEGSLELCQQSVNKYLSST